MMSDAEHLEIMSFVVARCREIAPDAVVFGSCASSKEVPGDLDLLVRAEPSSGQAMGLLRLARRHYGWLDVFIVPEKGRMLVRNPYCTGWDVAKHARKISAEARDRGIPISEFTP